MFKNHFQNTKTVKGQTGISCDLSSLPPKVPFASFFMKVDENYFILSSAKQAEGIKALNILYKTDLSMSHFEVFNISECSDDDIKKLGLEVSFDKGTLKFTNAELLGMAQSAGSQILTLMFVVELNDDKEFPKPDKENKKEYLGGSRVDILALSESSLINETDKSNFVFFKNVLPPEMVANVLRKTLWDKNGNYGQYISSLTYGQKTKGESKYYGIHIFPNFKERLITSSHA